MKELFLSDPVILFEGSKDPKEAFRDRIGKALNAPLNSFIKTPALSVKIRLEPIEPEHADPIQGLISDPEVLAWTSIPEPYPEDGAKEWIERVKELESQGREKHFAIRNEEERIIGVTGLQHIEGRRAELGYWIGRAHWNQGYASKANQELVRRAFLELGLEELYARPLEHNASSQRVLEKLGFEPHELEEHEAPKCQEKGKVLRYVLKRPL